MWWSNKHRKSLDDPNLSLEFRQALSERKDITLEPELVTCEVINIESLKPLRTINWYLNFARLIYFNTYIKF